MHNSSIRPQTLKHHSVVRTTKRLKVVLQRPFSTAPLIECCITPMELKHAWCNDVVMMVCSPANSGASRVDPASPVGSDTSCQASTQRRQAPPGQGLDPDPRSARPPTPINVGSGSKESSWGRQVVSRHARRRAAHWLTSNREGA